MTDGWTVEVKTRQANGQTGLEHFYARIPDREKAEQAVKDFVGPKPQMEFRALALVPTWIFEHMHIDVAPDGVEEWT